MLKQIKGVIYLKFCLKNRQDRQYLLKADEIKAEYRDHRSFVDLIENYPEKTLICQIFNANEDVDWKELKRINILAKENFICCVSSYNMMQKCKEHGIKFYFGFPISTFWELEALKEIGVCYVRLGAPLFFQMDRVEKYGIPVRAVPNVAYLADLPHSDGVCGTWIRPEDLDIYAKYIDVIEFEDCDDKKEQALFRIYAEQKNWPGSLNLLISNFNYEGVNRVVSSDLAQHRLNCRQKCKEVPNSCQLCYRTMRLANPQIIENFQKHLKELEN